MLGGAGVGIFVLGAIVICGQKRKNKGARRLLRPKVVIYDVVIRYKRRGIIKTIENIERPSLQLRTRTALDEGCKDEGCKGLTARRGLRLRCLRGRYKSK